MKEPDGGPQSVAFGLLPRAHPLVEQSGHQLTVMLPQEPIPLDGDLPRLAQVFANLLTNVAKYTEQGGRIWLTAERVGSNAIVKVRDTGIGIPAEAMPIRSLVRGWIAGESFYRLRPTHSARLEGVRKRRFPLG